MKRTYVVVIICQACAAVAAIVALRWLARYVGPETFGQYSLYQSVVAAAGLFLVSWPNAAVLRFGREEWTREGRMGVIVGARLALFLTSILVAAVIAWVADPWLRDLLKIPTSPFRWVALGVIVIPAAELAIYISQAVGRTEAYGYSPLITRGGFLVAVVVIPLLPRPVTWSYLAGSMIIATAAAAATNVIALPSASWSGFRVTPTALASILRYSWALPFAAISTYVVNWIDSWVIRGMRGVGPVGIYNWAYQTTAIATLTFAPVAAILTPRVIDARISADAERINRYARSILPIIVLVAGAVAVGMAMVFPLLTVIGSPAYAEGYPVILILLAALPFQLLGYLVTPLGNAHEQLVPKFVLASAAIAIANVVGDFMLVPSLGITGAALSTAVAFAIGGVLQVAIVSRCADFSAIWCYTAPAWILVPSAAALQFGGPSRGAGLIVAGVFVGTCACLIRNAQSAPALRPHSAFDWLTRLPRELTLSDVRS